MANTRELRRRIKSVKNTSQITKAMQMVAATKMRRAASQALSGRPYSETLRSALERLGFGVNPEAHPLLSEHTSGVTGVLLLTTDKALCGALNTNLFRAILGSHLSGVNVKYFTVGGKGRNFVVRSGKTLEADFENPEIVIFRQARQISKLLINAFLEGLLKEVHLVYPQFVSTFRQEAKMTKLLPIDAPVLTSEAHNDTQEFLFEPNPGELLDFVLTHQVETQIYQALLETKASEHSARMMAMQNATDNAKELVEDLQLSYNQIRQNAITNELLEITTAQAALE